jgi:kinesin family protein 2/24
MSLLKTSHSFDVISTLLYFLTPLAIILQEMNLLAEVDQPGSLIDNYVAQLNFLLSRKASGLVSLQARLARFQQRLKEEEILSRKKPSR